MTVLESNQTVAEIAAQSLAAVKVFERHGIDYCCGGKRPLAEVCESRGLDYSLIAGELAEALSAKDPNDRDWSNASLSELAGHIVECHHAFLRRELPRIAVRLEKVYRVYNQRHGETLIGLPEVFSELRSELEEHLNKEEWILFPTICAYEQATQAGETLPPTPFGTIANPIRMMELEHGHADNALLRIREITGGYSVPEYACVTYRALISGLQELEQDLALHIHLENNILFPRALAFESHQ